MVKLYLREGCPYCARVRRFMSEHGIDYVGVNVPRLGSERAELLALDGVDKPEVPTLLDGDKVIQGTDEIIGWLRETRGTYFGDPAYGLTRTLKGVSYADAVGKVTAALKTQGFGVLTEIDVKATLKKKLDVDFRPYIILGACNPPLAHQALTAEPAIGLLLPCNVVVAEGDDGDAVVSAIDPVKMFDLVGKPEIKPLALDVRRKLAAALAAIEIG